jgi:hypothetical protein
MVEEYCFNQLRRCRRDETAEISAQGILKVTGGIIYLLDTNGVTQQYANFTLTGNRATNFRGLFNARLHFLKAGGQFDLNVQPSKIEQADNLREV